MNSKVSFSSIKHGVKILRVGQPRGRDPLVNTPLISAGHDAKGLELFWISSWNDHSGCTGVLVNEWGKERVYRFARKYPGFYSAVHERDDVLWLCGLLNRVVRLQLNEGKLRPFPTGVRGALVFSGMAFDKATGKLFAAAHPPPNVEAYSFDTRRKKIAGIYKDFTLHGLYMRASFPNGDGTWTIVMNTPGLVFVRWDPANETIKAATISKTAVPFSVFADENGRRHVYVQSRGWFNPHKNTFDSSGPKPPAEMTWFARRGKLIYGAIASGGSNCEINEWNLADNSLRPVTTFPDASAYMVNMTSGGDLVCVNLYGYFYRVSPADGATLCARRLATDSYGPMQCLLRLDREHLIGTNFITQRFWQVNLKTGCGQDCGRAAPGNGQIALVWKIRNRAYMAAYTGGQLMEYNWKEPARFPENPRVVTTPPHGMRPVAGTDDGRYIFYACNAHYGKLGGTLTKYDTCSGRSWHRHDIIPGRAITSLWLDHATRTLLCGTTIHGDQRSCPPARDAAVIARISTDNLTVLESFNLPLGAESAYLQGPLAEGKWLFAVYGKIVPANFKGLPFCLVMTGKCFKTPGMNDLFRLPAAFKKQPDLPQAYAGRPGLFVCRVNNAVELWDLDKMRRLAVLWKKDIAVKRIIVQNESVYLTRKREIIVLENALAPWMTHKNIKRQK